MKHARTGAALERRELIESVADEPERPRWKADSFFRRFAMGVKRDSSLRSE